MVWLDLAELLHKSLAETLATVPNSELYLWIARAKRREKRG
jgi:hypothetical protein